MNKFYKIRRFVFDWLILLNITLIIAYLFLSNFAISIVSGVSMYPTYEDREIVLGDVNFKPTDVEVNDVVAFEYSTDGTNRPETMEYHIKRVIGVPGDKITFDNEEIYRNDELVIEASGPISAAAEDVTLAQGEYYVVGDNYTNSSDSRIHGPVKVADISMIIIGGKDNINDSLISPRFFGE